MKIEVVWWRRVVDKNKKGWINYIKGKCKRHFYILGNLGWDMNVVL